jgi:hypothetical protein
MDGPAAELFFVASGSCCSGTWNRERRAEKEQGGGVRRAYQVRCLESRYSWRRRRLPHGQGGRVHKLLEVVW